MSENDSWVRVVVPGMAMEVECTKEDVRLLLALVLPLVEELARRRRCAGLMTNGEAS